MPGLRWVSNFFSQGILSPFDSAQGEQAFAERSRGANESLPVIWLGKVNCLVQVLFFSQFSLRLLPPLSDLFTPVRIILPCKLLIS